MMSKVSTLALTVIVSTALSLPANGMMRRYSATIEQSSWSLVQNSATSCVLEHQIPRFGKVNFSSVANKNINLDFALDMLQKPALRTDVELRSMPPQWKTGQSSRHITDLVYFKEFNGEVLNKHAWVMLNELEKGMQPTFYYQDWYSENDSVAVSVSSVNFAPQHLQFMECVSQLLRYSFDDIAFTTLHYLKNSNNLDRRSRNKLKMIQDYLKHEPEMELVLIDSYTDSVGGRYKNEQLSKSRANDMKKILQDAGIAGDKIRVNGFGEKRHIASIEKLHGRDSNRRVVITLNRGY